MAKKLNVDAAPAAQNSIFGIISNAMDEPLANVKVKAYHKHLRAEQLLGETSANTRGFYHINYTPVPDNDSENNLTCILIRVFIADDTVLGESSIHLQVPENFEFNFKIDDALVRRLNEFDMLVEKVKPAIESQKLAISELKEDKQFKDISFLAHGIGESAGKLVLMPDAFRMSSATGIEPAFFYALARMNFPSALDELLLVKRESVRNAIQQAIGKNIISTEWEEKINEAVKKFDELAVQLVLKGQDNKTKNFQKLIGAALPQAALQQTFVSSYLDHEDNPSEFWKHLAQQPGFTDGKSIAAVKSMLELHHLTKYQSVLASSLFAERQKNPALKELRGFAAFTQEDWKDRIKKLVNAGELTNLPDNIGGDNPDEKTNNYAISLARTIKQLYPTDVFAHRMKQDTTGAFNHVNDDLQIFFSKNPEYKLGSNNIHASLAKASFESVQDKKKVVTELEHINRLHKLTDDYAPAAALRKANITSASGIALRYGKATFQKQFGAIMGSDGAAEVYRKAQSIHKKATALAISYKSAFDVPVYAINGTMNAAALAQANANLQEMFGDATMCDCAECSSVHSPAAYFVDILRFLKDESPAAFTELIRRRPDLPHIHLTCANTNTPLPYIDIVNELLDPLVVNAPITAFQTSETPEELAAYPQHTLAAASAKLGMSNATYRLPFSDSFEKARILLENLGTTRQTLLETFLPNNLEDVYENADVAREILRLNGMELMVLNGTQPIANKTGNPAIPSILAETGLSYTELLQVLESFFINPLAGESRTWKIVSTVATEPATCDTSKLEIPGMNVAGIIKIIRFTRLQKKLGWSVVDLDRVLTALNITSFDLARPNADATKAFNLDVVIPLSQIIRLQQRLGLPVQKIIALQSFIDKEIYLDHTADDQPSIPSLYDQLFRDKAVFTPINPAFKEKAAGLAGTLTANTATLLTALNISQDDLTLMMANHGGLYGPIADGLNLQNLSLLFRRSLLPRLLGLNVREFIQAVQCTGITPFGGGLGNTLRFIDRISLINSQKISVDELGYLLRLTAGNPAQVPSVEFIAGFLSVLRTGLKQISIETGNNNLSANDKAKAFVIDKFSTTFNADHATVKTMLETTVKLAIPPGQNYMTALLSAEFFASEMPLFTLNASKIAVPAAAFIDIFNAYRHADKINFLVQKYKLTAEEVSFVTQHATGLQIGEMLNNSNTAAPFITFRNFTYLIQVRDRLTARNPKWLDLLLILLTANANEKTNFINALSAASGIDITSLGVLLDKRLIPGNPNLIAGLFNAQFPNGYITEHIILRVLNCVKMAAGMGASVKDIVDAVLNTPPFLHDATLIKATERLLKSRSSEKEWLLAIKPVSNRLRIQRRDALTDFLLYDHAMSSFRASNNIADANSLYEHLLVDVEMEACMYTSRIKQAISSVQLFVDRCLMNLEPNVTLGEDFDEQWRIWRKQYRVWEANRKIFLYPENWIEPELRDDKTPLFKEVESKLLQDEATAENVEESLREYLINLEVIANLEIIGHFRETTSTAGIFVHVFGRTREIPNQYYYRKQADNAWTPWEKVDVEIEGDYILPVVWNNRLMLFWTIFTEKQIENPAGTTVPAPGQTIPPQQKDLEIKLAWSEYKNKKWSGKRISEAINLGDLRFIRPKTISLHIQTRLTVPQNESLYIRLLGETLLLNGANQIWHNNDFAEFKFNHFNNKLEFFNVNSIPIHPSFVVRSIPGTETKKMFLKAAGGSLSIFESGSGQKGSNGFFYDPNFLTATPATVELFRKSWQFAQLLPDRFDTYNFNGTAGRPISFFYDNGSNHNFYACSVLTETTPGPGDPSLASSVVASLHNVRGTVIDRNLVQPLLPALSDNSSNVLPQTLESVSTAIIQPVTQPAPAMAATLPAKTYTFQVFYHPYVADLIKALNADGINGIYKEGMKDRTLQQIFTTGIYDPTDFVTLPYPQEKMDFDFPGPYSVYNWELFFHLPLMIATRLSKNQRFEEARKWFHYIFNPTRPSIAGNEGPERFWITQPFKEEIRAGILNIEEILNDFDILRPQLDYWEQHPFKPHAVARIRVSAYMRATIIKYIDNLLAWGDQLFARDTIESINEATLLYMLAANILGKRPEKIPARAVPVASSFNDIQAKLDDFSNANVNIQLFIPPSAPPAGTPDNTILMPLFGVPGNDVLLKYWDIVADRLFKIRHCMNIQGVARQLPLFEPPIDPALLVKAAAMGLDLNSIMNEVNANLPNYRFQVMLQKANELCNDVKGLGHELLTALEKKDAEQLALLRSGHEQDLLKAIRDIKNRQRDEAKQNLDSLNASRNVISERKDYYASRPFKNKSEEIYFDETKRATRFQEAAVVGELLASLSYLLPDLKTGGPFTLGVTYGGTNIGHKVEAASNSLKSVATLYNLQASLANISGNYQRRRDDWNFQASNAGLELKQVDKQITAAEIRLAIAEKDLQNHDLQRQQAREVNEFMRNKFTNAELYDYMVGQISAVYFQSYQLAYNTAKKAERCMQYELGIQNTSFIQFGYWDSLKKGLLSAEKLQYDLRRLEHAYIEQNNRELEITKHISTALINPLALLQLKETGKCTIQLPEVLFDLDFPGHYFRRIKSVSMSIPCIAGPYTSVNATLRLTSNEYRIDKSATNGTNYKKTTPEADTPGSGRFRSGGNSVSAIATSNAQNDSGVFELNFRDERYLPFEGAGAASSWSLELMEDASLRQFDYETISDIILHVKYTAREGGAPFKAAATENLISVINAAAASGIPLSVLFDIEHEFGGEWHKFITETGDTARLNLRVSKNRLPFFTSGRNVEATQLVLFAKKKKGIAGTSVQFTINNKNGTTVLDNSTQLLRGTIADTFPITENEDTVIAITMSKADALSLEGMFLVLNYRVS